MTSRTHPSRTVKSFARRAGRAVRVSAAVSMSGGASKRLRVEWEEEGADSAELSSRENESALSQLETQQPKSKSRRSSLPSQAAEVSGESDNDDHEEQAAALAALSLSVGNGCKVCTLACVACAPLHQTSSGMF